MYTYSVFINPNDSILTNSNAFLLVLSRTNPPFPASRGIIAILVNCTMVCDNRKCLFVNKDKKKSKIRNDNRH
jgi:hypothetical protein